MDVGGEKAVAVEWIEAIHDSLMKVTRVAEKSPEKKRFFRARIRRITEIKDGIIANLR